MITIKTPALAWQPVCRLSHRQSSVEQMAVEPIAGHSRGLLRKRAAIGSKCDSDEHALLIFVLLVVHEHQHVGYARRKRRVGRKLEPDVSKLADRHRKLAFFERDEVWP